MQQNYNILNVSKKTKKVGIAALALGLAACGVAYNIFKEVNKKPEPVSLIAKYDEETNEIVITAPEGYKLGVNEYGYPYNYKSDDPNDPGIGELRCSTKGYEEDELELMF